MYTLPRLLARYTTTIHYYDTLLRYITTIHYYDTLLRHITTTHYYDALLGYTCTIHYYGMLARRTTVIKAHDLHKNSIFPRIYEPYLVLVTTFITDPPCIIIIISMLRYYNALLRYTTSTVHYYYDTLLRYTTGPL